MKKRDWIWWGASWLFLLLLVNPLGNFPLNDDWGYAQVVSHLAETGEYRPGDWPVMTLFSQVIWGTVLVKIFGFSFSILRISTLLLAIWGSYRLYRKYYSLSGDLLLARTAFFVLLLNPLFCHLSFTFMTDVPFTVAVLAALLHYHRAMDRDSALSWFAAIFFTIVAMLIRQPAILLAPAFGMALLLKQPSWKYTLWAVAASALSYAALLAYVHFLSTPLETPGAPASLQPLLRRLRLSYLGPQLLSRGGLILTYLGVYILPLTVLGLPALLRQLSSQTGKLSLLLAAVLATSWACQSWPGAPLGNIIDLFGLGPTTLPGPDKRYLTDVVLNSRIKAVLIPLAAGGLFLLLWQILSQLFVFGIRQLFTVQNRWKLGLLLFAMAYFLYLLIDKNRFDRYHLVLLPVLLLLFSGMKRQPLPASIKLVSVGLLVLFGLFSMGGTRDYLSWNRSRWAVLDSLTNQAGITPSRIDGGLEFNGWHATHAQNPLSTDGKSWWFVDEDEYVLSFSPIMGCAVRTTAFPLYAWWPGPDSLYLHQRPAVSIRDTIFSDLETLGELPDRVTTDHPLYELDGGSQRSTVRAHSGRYAFALSPEHPFAGKLRIAPVQACEAITISVWRWGDDRSAGIVATAPDSRSYYTFEQVFSEQRQADGWHRLRHELRLPPDYPSQQLDIYLWNPVADTVWMDDLQVIWRRSTRDAGPQ